MIDPDTLARQRAMADAYHAEAAKLEAEARLKAAREEAVRLGVRKWCTEGCGRVVTLRSEGVCHRCQNARYMRRQRAGKGMQA